MHKRRRYNRVRVNPSRQRPTAAPRYASLNSFNRWHSRLGLILMASFGTFATVAAAIKTEEKPPSPAVPNPSQAAVDLPQSVANGLLDLPPLPPLPAEMPSNPLGQSPSSAPPSPTIPLFPPIATAAPRSQTPPLSFNRTEGDATEKKTATNSTVLPQFDPALLRPKLLVEQPKVIASHPAIAQRSRRNITPHREVKPNLTRNSPVPLALNDAVALALENNRDIKDAYLERIAQRADLYVAEGTFVPKLTPRLEGEVFGSGINGIDSTGSNLALGADISLKIPTGTEFSIAWGSQLSSADRFALRGDNRALRQRVRVTVKQPLLRNAGVAVNTADLEKARLTEKINVLALKTTLTSTVTNVILAYRDLRQAQEQLTIERLALENAIALLERDRALVELGRIARVDLVQSQALIAKVEVRLTAARNALASARLTLIDLLDINPDTPVVAVEPATIEAFEVDAETLEQFMFAHRPEYLQSKLQRETAKLSLLQAENNRRWNLDLEANYGEALDRGTEVRGTLVLSRELNDRASERDLERSRINLQQAENRLAGLEESLKIELSDRLREVDLSYQQAQLATEARALAQRNLEIAQERRATIGRSDIFRIVDLQNDLVQARNDELSAIVSYRNARTRLDQTIGNTLNTWGVTLEPVEEERKREEE